MQTTSQHNSAECSTNPGCFYDGILSGERVKEVPGGCFENTQDANTFFFFFLKSEAAGIIRLLAADAPIIENSSMLAVPSSNLPVIHLDNL